ncbi:hypothetical protein [Enterobacter cancerogenus]|uniref:MrpH family fimbial adhesin n=1 Tax=Enterobacter cancerogenus TaxID=69218 RepID=UPI000AB118B6|nr:hypothetical protein [Enterobacter cancerogenus]
MLKIITLLILWCASFSIYAAASLPLVSDVRLESTLAGDYVDFNYTMLQGPGLEEEVSVCHGKAVCRFGFAVYAGGRFHPNLSAPHIMDIRTNKVYVYTWKQLTAAYQNFYGSRRKFTATWTETFDAIREKDACVAFGAYAIIAENFETIPGGACVQIPTKDFYCNEVENSLNIAFGQLSQDNVNGATRSARLTLNCNAKGVISIQQLASSSAPSVVDIRPGELSAKLELNGAALNSTPINMSAGLNKMSLSAQLQTQGLPEPGPFSGQTVLIISYP